MPGTGSVCPTPTRPKAFEGEPLGTAHLRIHIVGASGSGTTTLGAALADRLVCRHLDVDDYYWEPTYPPFQEARPRDERQHLLDRDAREGDSWVLSGSLCGWGDFMIPRFQLVVFLHVPTEVRLARLRAREVAEFGAEALAPEGAMQENHREFLAWAASYDDGDSTMRSLTRHEAWLTWVGCPVVRFEGEMEPAEQVRQVLEAAGAD